jgi:enterobactin synthetase component F
MIPSVFVKLAALPLNANGKLDRAQLPEPLTSLPGSRPLTETETALAEIWKDLLGLDGMPGPDDDWFELGGDSLTAFELFDRIEARVGREMSPNVLLEASALSSLAALIDSGAEYRRLITLHAGGERVPTAYVHSGAGGMLTLRKFSAALGPSQPLYGIQAFLDKDIDEGKIDGVEAAASGCLDALLAARPHGPYILAGHSSGGMIAFEMALRLQEAGEPVLFVGLLDPPAPHTLRWRGRLKARALELTGIGSERGRTAAWSAALAKIRARLAPGPGPGPAAEQGGAQAGTSLWMENLAVIERRYEPRRYPGPVVVYATADGARYTGSRTLGWERYVDGPMEVRRVPGDHVSMLHEPNVDVVAEAMDADIREAQAAAAP